MCEKKCGDCAKFIVYARETVTDYSLNPEKITIAVWGNKTCSAQTKALSAANTKCENSEEFQPKS